MEMVVMGLYTQIRQKFSSSKERQPARHEEGFAHRVGREGNGGSSEQNAVRWKIKRYTQVPVQYDEDENDDLDSSVETKISQEFSNLGEGSHFVEYKKAQEIAKNVSRI